MSDKPRTFRVMVTRTGYRHGNITVTAVSEADALRKAREQAGNHDFSAEHTAEYTFDEDGIEEIIVEEPASELPHCIGCGATINSPAAQETIKKNLAVGMSTYSLDIVCTGCKRWLHIELGPGAKVLSMSVKKENNPSVETMPLGKAMSLVLEEQNRADEERARHEYGHPTPSIETMMRIAEDTKKRISFIKAAGKWAWGSRWRGDRERGPLNRVQGSERAQVGATDRLFDTFEEALRDAVEPYLNEETE